MLDPTDVDWLALRSRGIATTRWSVIADAATADPTRRREALAVLCQTYWFPVYSFLRRRGVTLTDAQDLTQDFFSRLLENQLIAVADPNKGRFRSFLLKAVSHFLSHHRERERAVKRGGSAKVISLNDTECEERYLRQTSQAKTAEETFERQWALAVLGQCLATVRQAYVESGNEQLFEQLKSCLVAADEAASYSEIAKRLKMTVGAVKMAVVRLRRRYRDVLLDTISQTLDEGEPLEDELRALLAAVRR